jgi:hypothetical protein
MPIGRQNKQKCHDASYHFCLQTALIYANIPTINGITIINRQLTGKDLGNIVTKIKATTNNVIENHMYAIANADFGFLTLRAGTGGFTCGFTTGTTGLGGAGATNGFTALLYSSNTLRKSSIL